MKTTIPQNLIFRTFSRLQRSCFSAVFLMLFLLFFGINSASAQKTWDGGASTTNWGDANNWSPNGVPTSSDNVVLSGNGITIKVNTTSATCNSIIIGGTAANTDAILTFETSGSPKLTVVNSVTVGGSGSTNNNRSGKITFVNGATLEAGSVVLTQSTSGDDSPGTITMTGGSTLITGSLAVGQGSATWTRSTGTVVLKSTNTLPATVFTNFNNLIINSGTTTTSGVSFSITGTMTVDGTLTPGATSHVFSGAGTVTGSGKINTNLASTTALTTQYSITTKTLSNLIVDFSGVNQSIASTATVGNYGGLITSGSGTKTLLGAITVNNNITTETGTTLDVSASNFAINLGGDWTRSGTFTQRSGTVTFNGTTQSIGGTTTTFYNLILAGSGTKTFGIATTVSGNLNINTGVIANLGSITTHTAGTLTLGDMGTIGSSKYGSTSTVATAPVYKNNTYFTAGTTGFITVSNSSCVAPTFTISSIPSICAGSTSYVINYSATTGNADLYSISGTGITTVSNGALNAAPSSITVALSSAAVAGTITPSAFTISSSVTGCVSANLSGSVTVTAAPSAGSLSGTQAICSNGTSTFTSNGNSGGAWTSSNTAFATVVSGTGVISGVAEGTATMTYTITGTGGCSNATATRTVTVTAAPSAGSISGTQAICVGGTSNLSSTVSGGTWQSNDSGIATINSTTGVAYGISSGVATMTYTITGTGGCSNATATRTVTVNSAPSAGTLSGTQTVCVGATTTFSSTISGESWSSGSIGVATINSSTGVITGVSAGTAIITYTFSGNGVCENATATRTVTVNPTFIASVSIASSDVDNTICPGTSVTFTATPTNGGTSPSYQWKLNGSTNVGSNSPTFVTTALANNDLVTVEMTSNETCVTSSPATSNSISTTVDSNLPASVSIISSDNDNTICFGSNVVFTATPNNAGSPSYQWKLNGNSIGSDSDTFTSSSLADNDEISVVMSSQTCSSGTAVTSNSITTVVNPSSVGGTVNSPTLCYNTAGNILLSGYTGTIQWQQSLDGLTGWANISGATSNTYTTPNLTAANSYRAVVTSGICSSANSNVSVVNVDDENVNTWIGTTGNWNDATKWRCGTVPTGITAVVVSGGSPVINADCSVKSITVSGTGLVTVQSSVTLTMIGGITTTVATQFVLESNANLLQADSAQNVGPIIVKRNSSSIMRLDYTLWSSPVASQGLYAFSKATLPNRFYKYDTETNLYSNSVGFNLTNLQYPSPLVAPNGINGTDSNNVMFNTAQGYLIRVPWNHPIAPAFWTGYFVGVPNNGTINYTMSDFGVGKRFNLVGNPYPSPISISQFVQDNATNITSSVYFFRKTNGNTTTGSYCEWNDEIFTSNNDNQAFDPNDSVRTGQGFFVEATGAGNTIVFNNGQRVNDADNQFFRQNANNTLTSQNVFWLNLTGTATQFSQTAISYKDYATNGVDRYDAKRMSPGTISLTSLVDGFNMGIQSKSAFVDTDVVLLSMIVPTAGSYSITLDRKSGLFADGQIIYLKDKLLNVDFNLATGSYTFVSEAGTFNDRFEIQYERNSLGVTTPIFNENQVVIYKTPTGGLSIKTGNITMSHVKVFDISGKLLFEKKDINASQTEFNIGLTTEILLVQITSDDGVVVTKKVLFPRTTLKIDKKIEVKSQLAEDE